MWILMLGCKGLMPAGKRIKRPGNTGKKKSRLTFVTSNFQVFIISGWR